MITALQLVAEQFTLDPLQLLKLQHVSREFRQVFRSDHVWRYMNVYGVESGICDHLLANLHPPERSLFLAYFRNPPREGKFPVLQRDMRPRHDPPTSLNFYLWLAYLKNGDYNTDGRATLTPQFYWCAVHWTPCVIELCCEDELLPSGREEISYTHHSLHPDTYALAVQLDPMVYPYLPLEMRQNRELLMGALTTARREDFLMKLAVRVPREFYTDMEVMRLLIDIEPLFLFKLPPEIRKNRELVVLATLRHSRVYDELPPVMQQDREIALAAVRSRGERLAHLQQFSDDFEFVEAAVRSNADALQFASRRLRSLEEIVLLAVTKYGLAAAYMDPSLEDNMHLAAVAVKNDCDAIAYFPPVLYNRKLMLQLIKRWAHVAAVLPEHLSNDLEFALKCARANGNVWLHMPEKMRIKYQFTLACVKSRPGLYLNEDFLHCFKVNRGIIKAVVKSEPSLYDSLRRSWRRDPEVRDVYIKSLKRRFQENHTPYSLKGVPRTKTRQKKTYKKRKTTVKEGRVPDEYSSG